MSNIVYETDRFNYLGLVMQKNGSSVEDMKNRFGWKCQVFCVTRGCQ